MQAKSICKFHFNLGYRLMSSYEGDQLLQGQVNYEGNADSELLLLSNSYLLNF